MSDSGHFLTNRPPQAGVKLGVRRHPEVTHTADVCLCMCLYVEKTSMSQHVSLSENTVDHVILFILLPKKQEQAYPPRTCSGWMTSITESNWLFLRRDAVILSTPPNDF